MGAPKKNSRAWSGFLKLHGYGVSTRAIELHKGPIRLVGQVTIEIPNPQIDEVAGLDFIGGSAFRREFLLVFGLLFGKKLFGERLVGVPFLDDRTAGRVEKRIRGDVDLIGSHHVELEFLFEFLRIINRDDVSTLELKNAVALGNDTEGRRHLGHEQALARSATDQVDLFGISSRLSANVHRDAGMPSTDSQVAVLNDNGESNSGFVPTLGGLAQTPDCPQELELIHEALLDPVYFGQVVEGFVGKLDVRHTLQNRSENVTGPVAVPLVACKQSTHELCSNDHFRITTVGQILKDFLRLGIVFLSHEGFSDSEFRLDRILAVRIGVLNRGVFAAGGVETQPLEIITGQ